MVFYICVTRETRKKGLFFEAKRVSCKSQLGVRKNVPIFEKKGPFGTPFWKLHWSTSFCEFVGELTYELPVMFVCPFSFSKVAGKLGGWVSEAWARLGPNFVSYFFGKLL